MDSLIKENFWNELKEKYPAVMHKFLSWVDEYKKQVNWEQLFNYGIHLHASQGWHNPKYHDLPIAMQIGIFIQFTIMTKNRYDFIPDTTDMESCKLSIEDWIYQEHNTKEQEHQEAKYNTDFNGYKIE